MTLSSLISHKKLILLDFWASWCKPCINEIPGMTDLYANYKDRGLEIVGISLDENESAWKTAIEKNNMQWIQLIIDGKNPGNAAEKYNVTVIPFTVFHPHLLQK